MSPFKLKRKPVPCQHIADYYNHKMLWIRTLGDNLLRRGYAQWASGRIERGVNNLYGYRKDWN